MFQFKSAARRDLRNTLVIEAAPDFRADKAKADFYLVLKKQDIRVFLIDKLGRPVACQERSWKLIY
jgi:hypothetical protein